jgi:multidrug efflux pump
MSTLDTEHTKSAALPSRGSLASFFIARPVFAIVLAIATCLGGAVGIFSLPISQYPEIAPTTIRVGATYSGASAEAVENSVTTVIESAMTGFTDLLYMESSSSNGSSSITLTFGNNVDADIAQVQVQNKLALVESRLPDAVQQAGLTVNRSGSSILMIGNIISNDSRYSSQQLADIMDSTIQPVIEQVEGVGSILSFGSGYAMRIWLDPLSLAQYKLTPSDVTGAIEQQNVQVSVGELGSSPRWPASSCA